MGIPTAILDPKETNAMSGCCTALVPLVQVSDGSHLPIFALSKRDVDARASIMHFCRALPGSSDALVWMDRAQRGEREIELADNA
jgi:hypothetical protein